MNNLYDNAIMCNEYTEVLKYISTKVRTYVSTYLRIYVHTYVPMNFPTCKDTTKKHNCQLFSVLYFKY